MKEPIQIRSPPRDFLLVVLGVDESRDRISFALLDDLPPNRRHSSAARLKASEMNRSMHGLLVQLTTSAG